MSALLNTAITGIRLNQAALSTTGHNIVNANTEGYSRQSIVQSTNPAMRTTAGYIGTGVHIDEIIRHSEKYLVDQVVRDIGVLSDADAYLGNVSQVNNLLAADQTNLAGYMNNFFDAVNQSVNDPGSILGRQLLLTQSEQMVAGFKAVESRLLNQNDAVNKQLQGAADNVTSLGKQIAAMNKTIGESGGTGTSPNDLLDKLDLLVRELGRYVNVSTVSRADGGQDVFIGQGQPLVIGSATQTLKAIPGGSDASRFDLVFVSKVETQKVTNLMTGGELGGLLRFRQDALQPAIGALGLLATAIADSVNKQNHLGMDLEGSLGGNIFADVNDPLVAANRVKSAITNTPPNDRNLNVTIESLNDLKVSDYELTFPGPGRQFVLTRLSDREVVSSGILGTVMPQSVEVDGFSINFEGGTFQPGDRFLIKPTSSGASELNVQISRAEEFAFASPIRVESSSANQGGIRLLGTQISSVDTALFQNGGELNPPMLIRFTSATTYDILDYSDPANPVAMIPPMTNLSFSPGANNKMFPADPGGSTVVAEGPAAGALQIGSAGNGYPEEVLRLQTTDPDTGFIREQQLVVSADESASSIARRLSGLNGVQATAYTSTVLGAFQPGAVGDPLQLSLNGVNLVDPDWVAPGAPFAQPVPDPLTADFLRNRINADPDLKSQGIFATSDGIRLTVNATTGVDLKFKVNGVGALQADGQDVPAVPLVPGDPEVDFTVGGKLQLQLASNIEMSSNLANGNFGTLPDHTLNFIGIQVSMTSGSGVEGQPRAGDSFVIAYNSDGSADNRNGSALLALNSAQILGDGNQTYQDVYGQLAEKVGILTSQGRINQGAGESMLRQSMDAMQSMSGVNLEEEAAKLIQLEQHYNASARLITLARDLFDTLLRI